MTFLIVCLSQVQGKDIENIRIIVFRRLNQFEIGGNVITSSDYVPTLKVSMGIFATKMTVTLKVSEKLFVVCL